jgi:redox-sensitive bicupin YhaK (pirin superfamily)
MPLRARTVAARAPLRELQPGPGLRVSGLRHQLDPHLEPWVGLEHFRLLEERRGGRPHLGLAVLTYLFEDSRGALVSRVDGEAPLRIAPGAVHCLQSVRGVVHELAPEHAGTECHGLRMTLDLRGASDGPCGLHAGTAEIPEVSFRGARVRVLAGSALGLRSPLCLLTPVTVLDVHLAPSAELGHLAPSGHHAWAIAIQGDGMAGPPGREVELQQAGAVAFAADGDAVRLRAGPHGLHAVVAHAAPLRRS